MKIKLLLRLLFALDSFGQVYDHLEQNSIKTMNRNDKDMQAKLSQMGAILKLQRPAVDSSSRLTQAPIVDSDNRNPRLRMGMQKCVFWFCQNVNFDASISVWTFKAVLLKVRVGG